ncbi:hypothetical protein B296_00014829 [Ensete ventricosum]|uniref:Uncharacterized protein n=1 Tax=Ensete ventricosum TaxID=4639 RepID=A0A426Z3P6_ENSVE|nr:hypothetical protein B296_00014829 [Ensete ventricosum]
MTEVLLQSGLAKVKSMHRVDAIENSPGVRQKLTRVSGVCQDDAKVFAKRRPKLTERLSGIAEKHTGKSSLGTRREIAGKKIRGLATILPKVIRLCRS